MPTIDVNRKDLEKLAGKKFTNKELVEALMYVKGEIDYEEGELIKIDVKETNRPELWSTEGIARELKVRTGGKPKNYKTTDSKMNIRVEKSVKKIRPVTSAAVVKGINITEELLVQLIQLQEKVAGTFGRKRKEAAIGVYDYDKINGDIRYYGANPREKKFIPLEHKVEMDLDEILEIHPKGKEYKWLLEGKENYPIFEDAKGNVLSMPPVINSNYSGKVTEKTKNLFVEVSGFNREITDTALKVMVMALSDRGGKIETVTIIEPDGKKIVTPKFGTKKIEFATETVEKISGLELKEKEIITLLDKAGMQAKVKGKKLSVEYPDYRNDILHPIDVIEDIIIGYGYNNIKTQKPEMSVTGFERNETKKLDKARDVCIGLGLQEVLTFNLTSREKQEKKVMQKIEFVEIANPVSANWSIMRRNIYPELLDFLSKNKHCEYPQKIFEIGKTLKPETNSETQTAEANKLSIIISDKEYGFTQIKSVLESIKRELGLKCELKETANPVMKKGRGAEIHGDTKGIIGEVSEEVRNNFGLEQETVMLEIELKF